MYWKYLGDLLMTVSVLCLVPSHLCQDISKTWAVGPGEYPFLVLVEIQSSRQVQSNITKVTLS